MVFWKSCGGAQCDHHFRCFWLRGARENNMRAVAKGRGDFCMESTHFSSRDRGNLMDEDHAHTRATVDGSEILRSPVEVASLSQYLRSFYIPGGAGFLNHQQYTTVKWSVNDTSLSKKFGQRRPQGGTLWGSQSLIKHHRLQGFQPSIKVLTLSKGTSNGRW